MVVSGGEVIAAKPPLGQHWLNHQPSLVAMVAAARLSNGETVLEIGTGLGALTDMLIRSGAQVVSLEYDKALYERARRRYAGCKNLKLVQADVRKFAWQSLPLSYKICANIPYYLCANLLRNLTETSNKPRLAALLLPDSVADKIAAADKRSLLATIVQSHYRAELGRIVARGRFTPPPRVDSRIAVLSPKPAFEQLEPNDWPQLVKLFKIAFASPRQQLLSNLRRGLALPPDQLVGLVAEAEIDGRFRAERLDNEQWQRLFLGLKDHL